MLLRWCPMHSAVLMNVNLPSLVQDVHANDVAVIEWRRPIKVVPARQNQ